MNHWAMMLADAPAALQLLIARRQRISLPRGADANARVQRVRQALCRSTAVRAVYESLEAPVQAAVQDMSRCLRGISSTELARRYGAIRSWRALSLDPRPRTISEELILLGWLLPRPTSPQHPLRWLLPPELRSWLPQPLQLQRQGPVPHSAPLALALLASQSLIIAAAQRPLAVQRYGLRVAEQRRLADSLHSSSNNSTQAELFDFVLALLCDLALLVKHQGYVRPGPAADAFLALPAIQQLERLQHAWLSGLRPDLGLSERCRRAFPHV